MAQVKDPVCGMMVDSDTAEAKTTWQGQTYYFCSQECKQKFETNPRQYATAGKGVGEGATSGAGKKSGPGRSPKM